MMAVCFFRKGKNNYVHACINQSIQKDPVRRVFNVKSVLWHRSGGRFSPWFSVTDSEACECLLRVSL